MNISGRSGFGNILVAFDGSENSLRACSVSARLARIYESQLTVLWTFPPPGILSARLEAQQTANRSMFAKKAMEKAAILVDSEGVKARMEVQQADTSVVQAIIEYAADKKKDLIVTGTRGLGGFKRLLTSSVSSGVSAEAPCPVMVVRKDREKEPQFERMLVAVDGSESSRKAVGVALDMAKNLGAELTILHVIEVPTSIYFSKAPVVIDFDKIDVSARNEAEKLVSMAASLSAVVGVKTNQKVLRHMGSPVEGIVEYAGKYGIDLIVVGTRDLGGLQKLLLGSFASGVVSYAGCSVLVVR